ncbi:MAG: glycosyltransferase [Myxococcota bacterium]
MHLPSLFVLSLPRSLSSVVYHAARGALGLAEPTWTTDGEILNLDRHALRSGGRDEGGGKFLVPGRDPNRGDEVLAYLDQVVAREGFAYKDVVQPFVCARWRGISALRVLRIRRPLADIAASVLERGWRYPAHAVGADGTDPDDVLRGLLQAERALDSIPAVEVAYDDLVADEAALEGALSHLYEGAVRAHYIDAAFVEVRARTLARRRTAAYQALEARIEGLRAEVSPPLRIVAPPNVAPPILPHPIAAPSFGSPSIGRSPTTRILVIGDGNAPTGFGRVVHSILERMPARYDLHHLGINHRGDPHRARWPIYPAMTGGDPYGVDRVPELVERLDPALVFVVCDPWILTRYAGALARYRRRIRTVGYLPVEGTPLDPSVALGLRHLDRIVAYNQFGASALGEAFRQAGVDDVSLGARDIGIIPHGIDTKVFHPLGPDLADRRLAKKALLPDTPDFQDSFIVFNGNRNQPRKRIDITMKGFARFAQGKPNNVKLYLHMGVEDAGWNLLAMARRLGIEDRLILTSTAPQLPSEPEDKLNLIYNVGDVGITTTIGEGWGLVSFESAATGAPQIVPRHTSCAELWEGHAEMMEPAFSLTTERILLDGWFVTEVAVADALERLYRDPVLRAERGRQAYARATDPALSWDRIADQWVGLFDELLAERQAR